MEIDDHVKIEYRIYPWNAANKNVSWHSNNPDVATVDSFGTVRAISPGSAIITVTTEDCNLSDSAIINVNPYRKL